MAEKYMGVRVDGKPTVAVKRHGIVRELDPTRSQSVRNHSPNGFEWGYGGSGPAQLALAILLDHGLTAEQAETLHQDFKFDVVASLPEKDWQVSGGEIQAWIERRKTNDTK